jgi:hypothetical protein
VIISQSVRQGQQYLLNRIDGMNAGFSKNYKHQDADALDFESARVITKQFKPIENVD